MYMKNLLHTFFLCLFAFAAFAQNQKRDNVLLKSKEDSLASYGREIVQAREAAERFRADSQFTRILVRALRTPFSFYHPFDSLTTISRQYAPDSSFRIFTWQVSRDEDMHRRHGAIQMNTSDGSLKLFPLIDRTHLINNQADTVTNHDWWFGAIYYKIIKKEFNNRPYYTLLGYDEHSIRSTKKRMEVLQFDNTGKPVFGGAFDFSLDSLKKPNQARFWIEYKKNGNARLVYDEELDMVMYDHLISESNEPSKKFTYIPDGDYEGFKWVNGKWMHVNKVFDFKLEDGQAPNPNQQRESKIPVKKGG